ncbi:MAG: hypothetical protein ACOC3T_00070 [Bacteroidota bacterium]
MKIKIKDVLKETSKAFLLLVSEKEIWLPKSKINRWVGNSIVIPQWLAEAKSLRYTAFIHIPKKIQPEYNQEAIDELRFNPKNCD